jgi:hypothetical protein
MPVEWDYVTSILLGRLKMGPCPDQYLGGRHANFQAVFIELRLRSRRFVTCLKYFFAVKRPLSCDERKETVIAESDEGIKIHYPASV